MYDCFEKGVTGISFFSASIQTAFKTCNSPCRSADFFGVNEPVYEFFRSICNLNK
jgi:hypothetical protein